MYYYTKHCKCSLKQGRLTAHMELTFQVGMVDQNEVVRIISEVSKYLW